MSNHELCQQMSTANHLLLWWKWKIWKCEVQHCRNCDCHIDKWPFNLTPPHSGSSTVHSPLCGPTNCYRQRNLLKWSHWNNYRSMANPIVTTSNCLWCTNEPLLQDSQGRKHGKMPASIHSGDSSQFIYLYNVCYCYSPHQYPTESQKPSRYCHCEFTLIPVDWLCFCRGTSSGTLVWPVNSVVVFGCGLNWGELNMSPKRLLIQTFKKSVLPSSFINT